MKKISVVIAGVLFVNTGFSHESALNFRPESHAPAGVMSDHMHSKGEWMLGIRTMSRDYGGLYSGSEKVTKQEAAAAGFSMVATDMTMHMVMLDIMYAVNEEVTLMLMPQYMSMEMDMAPTSSMMGMSHAGHGASHSSEGIGDTILGALIRLQRAENRNLHLTIGVSAPTGSVDEKSSNGSFTHYGMQLGSGTWDVLPSLTYTGYANIHSWGGQLGARLPLENENDSGFAVGEYYFVTGWYALRVANVASVSTRLLYEKEGDINGHYNGAHNHGSPADFQANYGGEFVDLGIGVNAVVQSGRFAGFRSGIEWVIPLAEHYNGFQIGRGNGINLSFTYSL